MAIDRERLFEIFTALGAALKQPTTLCLIGSAPGILLGQSGRQTADIDVWDPKSDYDSGELARASTEVGLLFDPSADIPSGQAYIQLVRPGIVRLPHDFQPERIGRFGELVVAMPPAPLLVAAKLSRGSPLDFDDVAWWINKARLVESEIHDAADSLPDPVDRETAAENMILVELLAAGGDRGP